MDLPFVDWKPLNGYFVNKDLDEMSHYCGNLSGSVLFAKSKKGGNDQESIQSGTTPDSDTTLEGDKSIN